LGIIIAILLAVANLIIWAIKQEYEVSNDVRVWGRFFQTLTVRTTSRSDLSTTSVTKCQSEMTLLLTGRVRSVVLLLRAHVQATLEVVVLT
jgi:hypothetical protein